MASSSLTARLPVAIKLIQITGAKCEAKLNNADTPFIQWLDAPLRANESAHVKQLLWSLSGLPKYDSVSQANRASINFKRAWKLAASWAKSRELLPEDHSLELDALSAALESARILSADITTKGTQLKLLLELEGGQRVFFKPIRYSRLAELNGQPYSGFDRHNGEIAAFHLARLLDFRTAPIAVGRRINVESEIRPVASSELLSTFDSKHCFYGNCFYCSSTDRVCPEANGLLEGALVLLLPDSYKLLKLRHPWQRTYTDTSASWETDSRFCSSNSVKNLPKNPRILDLVDVAIFDFLIGNADRHHYELKKNSINGSVLLIDNGKSFGNSSSDVLTILAPLYQCCVVRKSTYQRLSLLRHDLGPLLKSLLQSDSLSPLLSDAHYDALNRRIRTVLATIEVCIDESSRQKVML